MPLEEDKEEGPATTILFLVMEFDSVKARGEIARGKTGRIEVHTEVLEGDEVLQEERPTQGSRNRGGRGGHWPLQLL